VPAALEDRWCKGFRYIAEQRIAPILVGEFGGRQTATDNAEGRWQRQFMDDWTSTDAAKVGLLQALMRGERIPAGTARSGRRASGSKAGRAAAAASGGATSG
jgi:hypothetical protein